jgi:hypothetical protein
MFILLYHVEQVRRMYVFQVIVVMLEHLQCGP